VGKVSKWLALARRVSSALHSAELARSDVPLDVSTPCTEAVNAALNPITRDLDALSLHRRLVCFIGSGSSSDECLQRRGPCWRVLPLALGAAFNVANLQGCAGIPSSYSSNKYPQPSTNAQGQDKSFHSRLSSALFVLLFTHGQLSLQVRIYINLYLGTIPTGSASLPESHFATKAAIRHNRQPRVQDRHMTRRKATVDRGSKLSLQSLTSASWRHV
jgi:hypothetical protein